MRLVIAPEPAIITKEEGGAGRQRHRFPKISGANANDRLPRASLGRVEGGDGIVEGRGCLGWKAFGNQLARANPFRLTAPGGRRSHARLFSPNGGAEPG